MKNQRTYFSKLFFIVALMMTAAFVCLGSFFYKDTLEALKLSNKQEIGMGYLSTLNSILQKVALHQHKNSEPLQTEIDHHFYKLKQMHTKYAHKFYISDADLDKQNKDYLKLKALTIAWAEIKKEPKQEHLHVNLISNLRELIETTAEHARVSVDSDLKVTYITEIIWLKAPENLEIISRLTDQKTGSQLMTSYLMNNLEGFRQHVAKLRFLTPHEEQSSLDLCIENPIENLRVQQAALLDNHPSKIDMQKALEANSDLVNEAFHYLTALKLARSERQSFHENMLLIAGIVLFTVVLALTIIYSVAEWKDTPKNSAKKKRRQAVN